MGLEGGGQPLGRLSPWTGMGKAGLEPSKLLFQVPEYLGLQRSWLVTPGSAGVYSFACFHTSKDPPTPFLGQTYFPVISSPALAFFFFFLMTGSHITQSWPQTCYVVNGDFGFLSLLLDLLRPGIRCGVMGRNPSTLHAS